VEIVETSLIKNKEQDQNTSSHANSEAGDIDKRIDFILPQIAPCGCKIIFEHDFRFMIDQ